MYIYFYMLGISLFFSIILQKVMSLETNEFEIKSFHIKRIYVEFVLLFMSMLPFLLISGLRRNIGYDYDATYMRLFEKIAANVPFNDVGIEVGYYWLNKLIIFLGGGYVWLFMLTSAIILSFFWIGFYQQSKNISISILMFFSVGLFFISMDGVRQFMGMAIGFYGLKYVKQNNFFKFALFILLGCLFHKSTLFLLPIYFFQYIKINPIISAAIIGICSLLNGTIKNIAEFVIGKTPYSYYITSEFNQNDRVDSAKVWIYLAVFIFAAIIYYVNDNRNNKMYTLLFNSVSLLTIIGFNSNIIALTQRVCWTYELALLLIVPYIISSFRNKWVKMIVVAIIIAICWRSMYNYFVVFENHGVIPYQFTFMPQIVFK